MSKKNRET